MRPCHLSVNLKLSEQTFTHNHTSAIVNLPDFAKNSLNTFDWTKLDYLLKCNSTFSEKGDQLENRDLIFIF